MVYGVVFIIIWGGTLNLSCVQHECLVTNPLCIVKRISDSSLVMRERLCCSQSYLEYAIDLKPFHHLWLILGGVTGLNIYMCR